MTKHASAGAPGATDAFGQSAKEQLRSYVERIERLEEEKDGLAGDIRDIYADAKGNGFDTKALRKVIALRKLDAGERADEEAVLATYMLALGMLDDGAPDSEIVAAARAMEGTASVRASKA